MSNPGAALLGAFRVMPTRNVFVVAVWDPVRCVVGYFIVPGFIFGAYSAVLAVSGAPPLRNGGFCALRSRRRARTKPPLKGEGYGTPCSLERASSGNRCAACLAAATSYTYIHSSYSSFARRYEHARRALHAERRTALLGFPLPAAQRIDARYEKTCRAPQRNPPIARGTLCPGHVLVPWAHSPIWSRQHPIFVSLIQIASYKR